MSAFIFILSILSGSTLCDLLPIVQPAPELQATYNKPVSFNCTLPSTWETVRFMIEGEIGFKFAVYKMHDCVVPVRLRNNYTINCNGNTLTLEILRPEDNKTWKCVYRDESDDKEHAGSTTLIIQPEMPSVTLQQNTYVITEGSDLTVPCNFIGGPISNVSWQRENDIIQWNENAIRSFNLSLKSVSRDMAGNYTCSATVNFKGVYTDSKSLTLVVKYPPTLKPESEIIVREGEPIVSIPCEILEDGYPRNYTTVSWQHFVGHHLIRNLTTTNAPENPVNSTFTLVLKSVSFNDSGSYICKIGNGVSNLKGLMEQTTCIKLVVQGTPKIVRLKEGYHGEIGKEYAVSFQFVGKPNISLKINAKDEETGPTFNYSVLSDFVEIAIYDTLLYMNGTIVEMTFEVIKDWFCTTYELTAKNAVGVSKHSFFVDGHDFPRKPYHVHFVEFETTALLEWEAGIPDLDKQYEIIVKKFSGKDMLYILNGTNSHVYEYHLTDLVNPSNTIQLCTTNVLGRNCTTTFKIKTAMHSPLEAKQTTNHLLIFLSVGLAILLCAFVLFVIIKYRRHDGFTPWKRRNTPFRTNGRLLQRLTNGTERENEQNDMSRVSVDTYITPRCTNSPTSFRQSCQPNGEGNLYACVDDFGTSKTTQQPCFDFGRGQQNGNVTPKTVVSEKNTVGPALPDRKTKRTHSERYTNTAMNGQAHGQGGTSASLLSSSANTCDPNTDISNWYEISGTPERNLDESNGGYCEIKHKNNVKYSKKWRA